MYFKSGMKNTIRMELFDMNLHMNLVGKETRLSVIGLGYVGLPLAVAFSKNMKVVGFDMNREKINAYIEGKDVTQEVGDEALVEAQIVFTDDSKSLEDCNFHIVAVPTPIHPDKTPDLTPVIGASQTLGKHLKAGSIVVYESTVYPGVTEEVCIPILERESGLRCGVDFKVGYSPERINPGDRLHRLESIVKVVSGQDEETLNTVAAVYETIIKAGVYRASSIRVAEAAKVIENSQRDINIAFMNELSIIFNRMGIDTLEVLKAARTKWNFLPFEPGLVGGHCIGVDPYYLTYKAEQLGYHSEVILAGRRINDNMGKYVAENVVKSLIKGDKPVKGSNVAILGFTFKEDCPDTRNTRVIDIVNELKDYGINAMVYDPVADSNEAYHEYGIPFVELSELEKLDVIIVAVKHEVFKNFKLHEMADRFRDRKILVDIKGVFDRTEAENQGYLYWRL